MRHLLLLLIVFTPLLSSAQPGWLEGYVVTNQADTLYGKIYYSPPGHRSAKISFKEEGKNEKIKYRPFTIRGYFVNDMYFVSRIYDIHPSLSYGKGVFMRWVNHGRKVHVKIYEYWNTDKEFGFNQTFLAKSGGSSHEIDPLRFRKTTAAFFKDFPALQKDILSGLYKKKELEKLVERYNSWRMFDKWNEKYKTAEPSN